MGNGLDVVAGLAKPRIEGLGILIIDMQDRYLEHVPSTEAELLIQRNIELVDVADHYGVPVAYIEQYGRGGTAQALEERILAMRADKRHCFSKTGFDAFENDNLAKWLWWHNITDVAVSGYRTAVCVRYSVWGAVHHGFRPILVDSAAYDPEAFQWDPTDGLVVPDVAALFSR